MKFSSFLPTLLFTAALATPAPAPADISALLERQLVTTNPTQDLTEVIKLATALNKLFTGDNIDKINGLINKTDSLLTAENLINLNIAIDGAGSLLTPDIISEIIALIKLILSFFNPNFVGQTQTMVPLVNKALPLFGKSMGFNLFG